jgi:ketosteroid isomerase-like protein
LAREGGRGLKPLSYHLFFTLPVLLVLAAACWSAPVTPILSPLTPTPSPARSVASDREAILALMAAEAEAAVHDDAARLLTLWAADGLVRDANHTPADPNDDYTWIGHDAILSRYLTVVFPLHLTQLARIDVLLTVEGDTATVIATTVIEGEVSPGGERWTFARFEGEWRITSITFNLEPLD